MSRRIRWTLLALVLVAPLAIAACGAAEEPATDNASANAAAAPAPEQAETAATAPAAEPATTEAPAPAPAAQTAAPQTAELVGEIRVADENFEWGATTKEIANYTWTAKVTNDTTATLDIIVRFEFLDDKDTVIKTESKRVRLDPAETSMVRGKGKMNWDEANRVVSFRAVTDYEVVQG